jgi:cytosine/adenosine deaminase-related metal-dependent hydrolase
VTTEVVGARFVATPEGITRDHVVVLGNDGREIVAVRPWCSGDPPLNDGLLTPGMVNAHTHLELSHLPLVDGGEGLVAWVRALLLARQDATPVPLTARLATLKSEGVVAICDISNGGDTVDEILAGGLCGVVAHEFLGMDIHAERPIATAVPAVEERYIGTGGEIIRRATPHGLYSTAPLILDAALSCKSAAPASIHIGEDTEEVVFVQSGGGLFAGFLDDLPITWRPHQAAGVGLIARLKEFGGLGPQTMLVHGVTLTDEEIAEVASADATIVLCPRSNMHISGTLPALDKLMAAGVSLAIGTDSLASCPSLSPIEDVRLLAHHFPEVSVSDLITMVTLGGARALNLRGLGSIAVGLRPGLVLFRGAPDPRSLLLSGEPQLIVPAFGTFPVESQSA